jgi:hypothetical protein
MTLNLICVIVSVLAISGLNAAPQARDFGLKVKVDGKAAYDKDTVTQTRKLLFNLSLAGKEPASDLVMKWVIYGHSRKDHDPEVIKSGELKVTLTPGQAVALETPQITITGVREHSVSTGSGRRRKSKKVPASGQEYFGYSAVLMSGSTVLAEDYSHGSLKKIRQ